MIVKLPAGQIFGSRIRVHMCTGDSLFRFVVADLEARASAVCTGKVKVPMHEHVLA